jgi:hypothetical protein
MPENNPDMNGFTATQRVAAVRLAGAEGTALVANLTVEVAVARLDAATSCKYPVDLVL